MAGASASCVIRRKELTSWNLLIADLPLAPVVLVSLGSLLPFEVHEVVALTSLRSPVGYARHLCRANAQRYSPSFVEWRPTLTVALPLKSQGSVALVTDLFVLPLGT